MPNTTDGLGGGAPSSICSVSPSDMAGQIDNLISRIEQLEQDVAELKAQNLSATQLSDISQSGGWIYDVTYLGVPGWTQTSVGTLIPPAGVSLSSLGLLMSDGNPYQLVSQDSDGVLHFGFNTSGSVSGSQSGGGGGISKYFLAATASSTLGGGGTPNFAEVFSAGGIWGTSNLNIGYLYPQETGKYFVTITVPALTSGAGAGVSTMRTRFDDNGSNELDSYSNIYKGGTGENYTFQTSFIIDVNTVGASTYIYVTFTNIGSIEPGGSNGYWTALKLT